MRRTSPKIIYYISWYQFWSYCCHTLCMTWRKYILSNFLKEAIIKIGNSSYKLLFQIDNTTTAFYDYTNHTSMELIKKSFKTASFFNIYRKCCVEAMDCCNNHMNNEIIKSSKYINVCITYISWSKFLLKTTMKKDEFVYINRKWLSEVSPLAVSWCNTEVKNYENN